MATKRPQACKAMANHLMYCEDCVRHYLYRDIQAPAVMPAIDPTIPWEDKAIEREQ